MVKIEVLGKNKRVRPLAIRPTHSQRIYKERYLMKIAHQHTKVSQNLKRKNDLHALVIGISN